MRKTREDGVRKIGQTLGFKIPLKRKEKEQKVMYKRKQGEEIKNKQIHKVFLSIEHRRAEATTRSSCYNAWGRGAAAGTKLVLSVSNTQRAESGPEGIYVAATYKQHTKSNKNNSLHREFLIKKCLKRNKERIKRMKTTPS